MIEAGESMVDAVTSRSSGDEWVVVMYPGDDIAMVCFYLWLCWSGRGLEAEEQAAVADEHRLAAPARNAQVIREWL